jgi:acetyl esterase
MGAGSRTDQRATAAPAAVQDLDPSTQTFVDGLWRSRPIYTLAPDAARAVLSDVQKSTKVTLPEVLREDRVLQVGPDGTTNIRMVSPAGASGKLPVVVYIHGGGWGSRRQRDA